jgi:hypothetical protein
MRSSRRALGQLGKFKSLMRARVVEAARDYTVRLKVRATMPATARFLAATVEFGLSMKRLAEILRTI